MPNFIRGSHALAAVVVKGESASCGFQSQTVPDDPVPPPAPDEPRLVVETRGDEDVEEAGSSHCDGLDVWFRGVCGNLRTVDVMFECPAGSEIHRHLSVDGYRQRFCLVEHGRRDGPWRDRASRSGSRP